MIFTIVLGGGSDSVIITRNHVPIIKRSTSQKYDDFLKDVISAENMYKNLKNIKIFIISEAGITYKVKIHKKLLSEIINDAEEQKLKITK